MKKIITVMLLLISACRLYADTGYQHEFEDLIPSNESIEYFFDESYIKLYLMIPSLNMSITRIEDCEYLDDSIRYSPNSNLHMGIELNFYHIGIAFSTELDSSDENDYDDEFKKIYGETDYRDILLSYYDKNFGVELSYQKYRGFYLCEPDLYGYSAGDTETKRSDLVLANAGARLYYNFADWNAYSIAAVFSQSERQKDWIAISFLGMFSADRSRFDSDYSLIPPVKEAEYGKYSGLKDGAFVSFGIAPGVGLSLSFFNFYAASSMFIGGGYQSVEYRTGAGWLKEDTGFLKLHFNLSGGYNGDTLLAGFNLMFDMTASEMTEKTGVDTETGADLNSGIDVTFYGARFEFFTGIRF